MHYTTNLLFIWFNQIEKNKLRFFKQSFLLIV